MPLARYRAHGTAHGAPVAHCLRDGGHRPDGDVACARDPRRLRCDRSLTKFISTIAIAVFIEGLMIVFRVSKEDVAQMLFPTALLLTAILIVVGLGVYQRLSADVERAVGHADKDKKRG
jgi:hypothetical protein